MCGHDMPALQENQSTCQQLSGAAQQMRRKHTDYDKTVELASKAVAWSLVFFIAKGIAFSFLFFSSFSSFLLFFIAFFQSPHLIYTTTPLRSA